jgi:hypothetical protein
MKSYNNNSPLGHQILYILSVKLSMTSGICITGTYKNMSSKGRANEGSSLLRVEKTLISYFLFL